MRLFSGKISIRIVALLLLVWPCFTLAQTATVVQSNSGFATGGTNPSVKFSTNNTAGNLLWVAVGSDATITAPTDSLGNTYTLAVAVTGSGGSGNAAIYYAPSALPGANTVTCNHSGNGNTHCHIAEINGLVSSSPLDQTGNVVSSSTCSVSTSGATAQANEWIGAFVYDSPNSNTLTSGTGDTQIQLSKNTGSGDAALSVSQNVSFTGIQTATCGGNSSNVLSQLITTFKASGSGLGPFISNLSPTLGPAGTSVTIQGSNFGNSQGNSTVIFNGTVATPTNWNPGSIVVPAPSGATSGNVVVTVGGTTSNGVRFAIPPGPPAVVQSNSGFATGGTNPSVKFLSNNTAGNLLWVAVGSDATITAPTDTLGNTYTLAVSVTGAQGSGNAAIYYAAPSRAGANTVTCNHTGNGDTHCHIAEVTGLSAPSPLDQTGIVASSSNCAVSTAATTGQDNEWIGAFVFDSPNSNPLTAGTSYTKIQVSKNATAGDAALSESNVVSSAAVETATCSGNSSNVLSQLITTFKAIKPLKIVASASPLPNTAGWNNTNVTVSYTCTDGAPPVSCPSPQVVTANGANQVITATASDFAGQTASASVTLNIDQTPPTITAVVSPAPNAAGWNNSNPTVTFTCSDSTSGVASCPAPQTVSSEGVGQTISGTAVDIAGNAASATATIKLDKTPPTVSIASPPNGSTISLSTVSIGLNGSESDNLSGVSAVTCNGSPAAISGANFTCTVLLTQGPNSISVQATDVAGNVSSSPFSLTYAPAPQLSITAPANLSVTNITPVTVNGTVSDPNATVTINGVPAPQSGGSFTIPIPLTEGLNVLTAVATNASGVASTATAQITLDTTPPHITIDMPSDGTTTTDASVTVTGLANDVVVGTVNAQDVQVTVNGIAAQVANRSYAALNVPLVVGGNTIQAVARDRAGNQATVSATVTRVLATQPPAPPVGNAVITQSLAITSGNNQTGTVGTQLPTPLVVKLNDSTGNPVVNQMVVFKVTGNNGTVSTSDPTSAASALPISTDSNGQAQVFWTLGQRAGTGTNSVQVSSPLAISPVNFSATGVTGGAAMIVVDSGNDQIGVLGQPLGFPFVADVVDAGHNRVPNVAVTFAVKQGDGNLAGANTQTVTTDSNGRAIAVLTLGTQIGNANNVVAANFPNNPALPASFSASARLPGNPANTTISGVVLDNSNNPIQGATIRLFQTNQGNANNLPVQVGTPIQTDAKGTFLIQPAPVGFFKLMADGTTASGPNSYPPLEYDIVTVAGNDNTVGMPIYLPALDTVNKLCVDETHGGTLTLPQVPGFALTVLPGSATFPGGSRTGCVSVTPVNGDKVPMAPGFGQQPRFIVTIQPVGTTFNPPAPITLPNVDGLAPKAVTEMYSYDHDLSMFVAIGTGTVSADGSVITSNPGVGVLKAGWHCGGNPNQSGGAENVTVNVSKTNVTVGVGQTIDVTATGQPGPIGNPAYTWTSSDPTIATAPFSPGNNSQTNPNVARITGVAAGTTTIKVIYKCQSGASATAQISVTVVQVDSLQASLPSTKNVATGTAPADDTFSTSNKDLAYVAAANDLLVALLNSGTITVKAINVQPANAAQNLQWVIQRNPDDTVGSGAPGLSAFSGSQTSFSPSLAGNFRLIVYIDINGNGSYDAGEELRVLRLAVVRTTIQNGSFIKTTAMFIGGPANVSTTGAMSIQGDFLLEGGGADRTVGVSQITLGNAGNLHLPDTFVVNYPVPPNNPPAPANVPGTESENAGGPIPLLDSVNVPHGGQAAGGNSPFRGHSAATIQGAGPNGNGQIIRVTSLDAPAFGWDPNHPVTTNPWATTQGGNSFRDFLVAYSQTFPKNYLALASGDWVVTAKGTKAAAGWTSNGANVTIPGAVLGSAPLSTGGMPAPADSVGAQLLGPSFVNEFHMDHNP